MVRMIKVLILKAQMKKTVRVLTETAQMTREMSEIQVKALEIKKARKMLGISTEAEKMVKMLKKQIAKIK